MHHYVSPTLKDVSNSHYTFQRRGLRLIEMPMWEEMLDMVNCKILSHVKNEFLDAYLLR